MLAKKLYQVPSVAYRKIAPEGLLVETIPFRLHRNDPERREKLTLLYLILFLLATIAFAMAAFGAVVRKINLIGLGLMFVAFVFFLQTMFDVA